MKQTKRKGFTLIELLIVIAIIAVLSVVVILSLNPAELLRQARDSNRISDMATLKSAIALYLADIASPSIGSTGTCYISASQASFDSVSTSGIWTAAQTTCAAWSSTATSSLAVASTSRLIGVKGVAAGNGWIPVNFSNISSGSPIGQEPVDPTNATGTAACTSGGGVYSSVSLSSCALFYSYIPNNTTFKLAAFMESTKYAQNGAGDVTTNDGGINNYVFESGTNPTL